MGDSWIQSNRELYNVKFVSNDTRDLNTYLFVKEFSIHYWCPTFYGLYTKYATQTDQVKDYIEKTCTINLTHSHHLSY